MISHWQDHKNRLKGYIARQVEDADAVDDILQDVYIKAHNQLHKLKSLDSLGAWLHRIAHNAIMDHYRQQRPMDELPDAIEIPEQNQPTQAHQEMARCLIPLIEELSEKYRTPLQLAEFEGLTQKQVADRLGLSLSGTKSRIQRGRSQLHQRLTACCDIEVAQDGVVDYHPKKPDCQTC